MDRATVIVAIPPVDERVNKVSSEAVPHLTLLYLGDVDLSEDAMLYVQHACEELSPFGLSVDYRGELGEDKADVLFFENNRWDLERVKEFRHWLLLNDEIKRAYDAADQYPEWTPHLTLGYPEAPARDQDDDDGRLGYIMFDRVAVWTGDFEGPTFRLRYDNYQAEVAMSEMTTAQRGEQAVAEMFHVGVKGMKWGVRKSDSAKGRGAIRRGATKASVSLDAGAKIIQEGEKRLIFLPHQNRQKAAVRTQTRMLAAAASVNQQKQFNGKDIKNNPQLKRSYFNKLQEEAKTIYAEELNISRTEAWGEFLGIDTSSATRQMRITAAVDKISHADEDSETLLVMNFVTDDLGHVVDIEVPDEYLKHEMFVDNEYTLVHYGVKGMKWGVRNNPDGTTTVDQTRVRKSLRSTDKAVTVSQRKAGTYVKAKGGERNRATTDAIKTQAARQVAKRSTTDALTNKQLKDTIERMRLEQEFAKLDKKVSRKGESFVSRLFRSPEVRSAVKDAVTTVSKKDDD